MGSMIPLLMVRDANALIWTGGRTILGRAMEILRREGAADQILVCPRPLKDQVEAEARRIAVKAMVLADGETEALKTRLASAAGAEPLVLLADADVVYDKRLLRWAFGWNRPSVLIDRRPPPGTPPTRRPVAGHAYVGLAAVAIESAIHAVENAASIASGIDACLDGTMELHDVETLPRYALELRKALRPYWVPVRGRQDVHRAKRLLVEASGKGHQELTVLAFNRPVEQFLAYFLCDWRITPNQITVLCTLVGLVPMIGFALGRLWAGLAIALVVGVLDGLDGRQARIQIKTSKLGEIEHVLDKIVEISWMAGLAWFLSDGFGNRVFLWLTLGWVAFHMLDNAAYAYFRRKRGMVIDEASTVDAAIRLFASNRNNNVSFLILGLLVRTIVDFPVAHLYYAILAWSVVTPVLHWIRIPILLGKPVSRLGPHLANRSQRQMPL